MSLLDFADLLTKVLPSSQFRLLLSKMSLFDVYQSHLAGGVENQRKKLQLKKVGGMELCMHALGMNKCRYVSLLFSAVGFFPTDLMVMS